MVLLRRSRTVPVRTRLQVSSWASAGVACLLLIVSLARLPRQSEDSVDAVSGLRDTSELEQHDRKLNAYPDDPIIEAKGDPRYSDAGNKYLVFLHVIMIGYMFLGLNTVCDIYFTGALDVMVDRWNIKPDVAGATFMAAGGSAPELASSLIGACYMENDVGFSTIVGSAVFNVLFVIGLCGAVVSSPIELTWWPLFRDCTYYIFGLIMLAIFSYTGKKVSIAEAVVLFLGYIAYCTIMYFNENLESLVKTGSWRPKSVDGTPTKPSQVAPVTEDSEVSVTVPGPPEHHKGAADPDDPPVDSLLTSKSKLSLPMQDRNVRVSSKIRVNHFSEHHSPRTTSVSNGDGASASSKPPETESYKSEEGAEKIDVEGAADETSKSESDAEDDIEELMVMPDEPLEKVLWILKLPIYGTLYYLTPRPTERKFLLTFVVSLLWIGGYSYFLIWWVDVIVGMVSLDINIAGITVLAAGTSIPDLVSSMSVARAGEGDMAVSSSIGSNIFDILVGLPFPWMIKILIVNHDPSHTIKIASPYIVVYVIILLFMVACIIISIHFMGWHLSKALGMCMAALYGIFMIFALILEIGKPEWAKI